MGEALWLATKTRPDILFIVNHMSTYVSRRPHHVYRVAQRLLAYLAGTKDLKLQLGGPAEEESVVTCFTDASYAPFGRRSFGASVVTINKAPVAWKAGRQSFITLSVMEAELYAATQGCLLLDAITALVDEVMPGKYKKRLAVDNTSAEAMLAGGPGSQRTRHLKIRANYVRESVQEGRLQVCHVCGRDQLADLATKLQPRLRLQQLLRLWGFVGTYVTETLKMFQLKAVMLVVMLMSLIRPSRAQPVNDKEPLKPSDWDELLILLVVTCVVAILLWEVVKFLGRKISRKFKALRRARKLEDVGAIAAEVANREIRSHQEGLARREERDDGVRERGRKTMVQRAHDSPTAILQDPVREATTPCSGLTAERSTSPVISKRVQGSSSASSSSRRSSRVDVRSENPGERSRVATDMLLLLTVEDLKEGLRVEGLPVSGVKPDLAARLAQVLNIFEDDREDSLPTVRQTKYVLWLFRQKNLKGRVKLHWETVNDRARISQWIERWRTA